MSEHPISHLREKIVDYPLLVAWLALVGYMTFVVAIVEAKA
jgi:hypothetical protein